MLKEAAGHHRTLKPKKDVMDNSSGENSLEPPLFPVQTGFLGKM